MDTIKEGEFKRLAQESSNTPNKFHLIGVSFSRQAQYIVRAGRTNTFREWRMDHLASLGISRVEVRFFK